MLNLNDEQLNPARSRQFPKFANLALPRCARWRQSGQSRPLKGIIDGNHKSQANILAD